jgi:hypothetical protein
MKFLPIQLVKLVRVRVRILTRFLRRCFAYPNKTMPKGGGED